ncbi:DUF1127 domain-containing protein [Bosea sp. 2KB_26]|uniref:DUF1127 domain-containing protein n=1 Tax=Bosea sp. 2KB_26 TaxID=3237475 RepID=UPI003F90371B
MYDTPTLATVPHQAARPGTQSGTPLRPGDLSRGHESTAPRRSLLAVWRWRIRFRWELARKAQENPRLINDIGLTRRQVAAEIAKPFWRR